MNLQFSLFLSMLMLHVDDQTRFSEENGFVPA